MRHFNLMSKLKCLSADAGKRLFHLVMSSYISRFVSRFKNKNDLWNDWTWGLLLLFLISNNSFNAQVFISDILRATKMLIPNYEKVAITNWGVINKTIKYSTDP